MRCLLYRVAYVTIKVVLTIRITLESNQLENPYSL